MQTNEQVRAATSDEPFKREHRYAVAKYKDMLAYMTEAQQHAFIELFKVIDAGRQASGKRDIECICIESDWPEYPVAWGMIEARMTGQTHGIATLEERRKDGMNGTVTDCLMSEVAELRAALATSAAPSSGESAGALRIETDYRIKTAWTEHGRGGATPWTFVREVARILTATPAPAAHSSAPLRWEQRVESDSTFNGVRSYQHLYPYVLAEVIDLRAALARQSAPVAAPSEPSSGDSELVPLSQLMRLDLSDMHTKLVERMDYWMCRALKSSALAAPAPTGESLSVPEVVEYQYRTRADWRTVWTEWAKCSADTYADYVKTPLLHDWHYEVRALIVAPTGTSK